jgi:hypothetical protein
MSWDMSGTSTLAATDDNAVAFGFGGTGTLSLIGGGSNSTALSLGAGTYTFKANYRNAGTVLKTVLATFSGGELIVEVF